MVTNTQSKKIEMVVQQLGSLPTLPAVAARLLQVTVRSDTQAQEVVQLIESDPSLASRIITLATRATTGINRRSASLSKAVVLLGFDAVRNAVLSIKVFESLDRKAEAADAADVFDRVGFWKHSLAVACAAKMLIGHIDSRVDPEEAFVCGLLHDLGKLALETCLPKSYSRVIQLTESSMANIADVERKIFGLDHTIAGRRLALKWKLPDAISECIWLHHQWANGLPEAVKNRSLVQAVHLADVLARQQRIGYSGNHPLPESATTVAEEMGCPATVVEQIARQLPEAISERADLLGLDDIDPEELYYEALGDANSELGRLNDRLREQNERLQLRSGYFELLSKLGSSLQAGQSVVDVCKIIVEMWCGHFGAKRCGIYASADDRFIIEGAVKSDPHGETTIFLVDRTEDPDAEMGMEAVEAVEEFSIRQTGQEHDWFFEQVAPLFETERSLAIPLRAGDYLVGELLWQNGEKADYYTVQIQEMEAFAAGAALAIRQAQKQEQQATLCEQLTQSNSELQKAQRELLQKRSLAAVGEMACGAAHEINNPLAVVVGRSQLLAANESDPEKKKTLENIAMNGQEISDIITDLLEFAQPDLPKPSAVMVEDLIRSAIETQRDQADEAGVSMEAEIDEEVPDVFVDRGQIILSLGAVICNAVESYGNDAGTVTVRAGYDDLNDEVVMEVIDQGCGMDQETLQNASSPFFSSKKAGRKRGLGLSRSVRNIYGNGGKLNLESEPGRGTCVRIALPVSQSVVNDELVTS